jgi:ABC-type ATPase with predicted acetyltransferase domain
MPNFNIIKKTEIKETFRNKAVIDTYELTIEKVIETFKGNIDIEDKDWNIGLIVGGSGTGKTTIAKEIFKDYYFENFKWTEESIIDNMPKEKTSEEITKVFTSVGLGTVWTWLKPYHVLSNGEMMRVNLARCILENKQQIVFDEFTSVVDRVVAQTASFAISKAVKKMNKKFVAVSCHRDIVDWLEPDWVYDTEEQKFFFAQTNTKDQKLTLKYINAIRKSGNYLRNITI